MERAFQKQVRAAAASILAALFCAGCILWTPPRSAYGPIHQFAKEGNAAMVLSDLATNAADLNAPDDAGETPLHLASLHCHTNVIAILINKKARIDSKDNAGATPLHLAAQEGCAEAVTMLIQAGAPVNSRDIQDRTPLKRAEQWHQDAVAVLLRQSGGTD